MNNVADVTLTGEATQNYFGYSVSSAGDVNGDGYSDIIVGAYRYSSNTGRVYLYDYFMKNEIVPDVKMTGEGSGNQFGYSVSSAGDVNGDGYSDVIVGAYLYSGSTGRAYVFFGGAGMDNVADVIMTGEAGSNYFGSSVSSAGDVNGDGYSDVIVGAYRHSSFTGRAYVFFGGAGMDNAADVTMTGEATSNVFGYSVSSAGDVNGDGYSDVIVGAYGYSSSTGRAYIFFGGAGMDSTADVIMTGDAGSNYFGSSVSSAGDVNGDGYSDMIVGAYLYSGSAGRAYVFFGGAGMNNIADVTMTGEIIDNYFGKSVSSAGDVNGDGYSDVIVGADGYSSNTGRAYVFFGGAGMDNAADVIMTGEGTSNYFGYSVSTAGDVNGDGYSDVIVGADGYSSNTGRSYIYSGAWSMDSIADVTMTGEITNNYFGKSVSSAGDVNGDGYSDLITGANVYSSFTGSSYIYLGSAISAKPILNYVKDVPNDQGGYVNIKWARSSYDVNGNDLISDYIVYRSFPPINGHFSWEERAVVPATKRSFYTFTDNTPSDSSTGGSGTMYYQIMARTSNPSHYWLSGILYGRSIDNIAPLMVSPFTAAASGPDVLLNWKRSTAPDLLNYVLFRNREQDIDPYSEIPLTSVTDSSYLDSSPLSGLFYYFLVAQDIHGNYSPAAVTESPNITVDLKMFIEGFYNAGSNSQETDTITVYLRNSTSPYSIADQTSGVVSANGTAQLKFGNAVIGNYYLQ
ncbi:MAG: FG-GAP repeat protein [Ignavibacteria bacterium]|nr:FG-GAP repeat protein [Ignavibacteria bacterium]